MKTAGGDIRVPEVILDSLELGGWTVRDVRVLVHDLPGQTELGLLGTNFLRNFDMDLKLDQGILELRPR